MNVSKILPLIVLAGWTALGSLSALANSPLTADEIIQRNFVVSKVADSAAKATFTLTNESGQSRVRTTEIFTKLIRGTTDNRRFVRFLAPPDIEGTVTLLIEHHDGDDDLWIYLPALKKTRRLVSSNKKDSFVGTDFTYGDIIGYRLSDWHYRLLKDVKIDNQDCFTVEASPASDTVRSDTGLSKRVLWIRKDNFVTVRAGSYDPSGNLLKSYAFQDIRLVDPKGAKWQPMRIEGKDLQSNHKTVITFDSFRVNLGIKDDYFTTRYMERED